MLCCNRIVSVPQVAGLLFLFSVRLEDNLSKLIPSQTRPLAHAGAGQVRVAVDFAGRGFNRRRIRERGERVENANRRGNRPRRNAMTMSMRILAAAVLLAGGLAEAAAADLSPDEARAIAKEAYIYGFPMVDSYRIQYAYFVDSKNPEYKAPWNQLSEHPACLHAGRHGDPDAQLGYALLDARHGPARRANGAHRAADREGSLLQCPAHRRLHVQLRLYRQPRDRQRWRQLPHRRARLERRDAEGREEGDPLGDRACHSPPIARSSSIRRPRQREEDPGRLQGSSRYRHFSASPRRQPRRRSTSSSR